MTPTFEYDLVLMSLVIFIPTIFALGLIVFPKGSEEWMRWWTLLGTSVTLVVSSFLFYGYYFDVHSFGSSDRNNSRLDIRMARVDQGAANVSPIHGTDWVAKAPWIERFNIHYYLGVDGISMPLVLLTTVLSFLAMLASWKIERFVRGYCMLFLLLETGMIGTFLALDFFLFFIFWEIMLLPMYFLIGVWGGPRREYAAVKFFLYTLFGSVFILVALLAFFFTDIRDFVPGGGQDEVKNSFDLVRLQKVGQAASRILHGEDREKVARHILEEQVQAIQRNRLDKSFRDEAVKSLSKEDRDLLSRREASQLPRINAEVDKRTRERMVSARLPGAVERLNQPFFTNSFQIIMFVLLFVGFAIKVPVFPFHTWLPDAHVEAPTPISMILAGVLLKMGGYGIIRIAYPICPWAAETLAGGVALLGVINIVYGGFAAMAQTDFKKLVAYSSISHMGYVILGIAVWSAAPRQDYWWWGLNGAMYQMIAHGISSAGMFFLVGVIYDRAHHRNLDNFRGLLEPMPLYGSISAIVFFAAMGLPGLCGFPGEFMVILAAWNFNKVYAILAALTVILTAAYILWTIQRVYFGQNPAYKDFPDIDLRELICIVPLVVLAVLLGVMPMMLLSWMEPTIMGLIDTMANLGAGS